MPPKLVCVCRKHLHERGLESVDEWSSQRGCVYVGASSGDIVGPWQNRFSVADFGRKRSTKFYRKQMEEWISTDPVYALAALRTLDAASEIGCRCHTEDGLHAHCHARVIANLLCKYVAQ